MAAGDEAVTDKALAVRTFRELLDCGIPNVALEAAKELLQHARQEEYSEHQRRIEGELLRRRNETGGATFGTFAQQGIVGDG